MSIPFAALMCHAPIVVPAVGGARGRECASTTSSMREVAQRLVACAPDAVVVISPHTPRDRSRFTLVDHDLAFDFGNFGAPETGFTFPLAAALARALRHATDRVVPITLDALDHGAGVPLAFLAEQGYRGPVIVLGLPWTAPDDALAALGRAIADAAAQTGARVAVVASGDMSHRLRPGAPSGFDPLAHRFDEAVCAVVEQGELSRLSAIDPALRERAAEDVVDSVLVAEGALAGRHRGLEVLSYEGPFGVGYLVAVLHDDARAARGDA